MVDLKDVPESDLVAELTRRGIVPVIWNVEDARTSMANGEGAELLSDDEFDRAGRTLLERASEGLRDVLGQRGNEYLDERWAALAPEIIAEVRGAPAP